MVYIDPPFNKKKTFTAPIGSSAEGASFKDIFRKEDVKDEWLLTIREDHDKLYTFLESVKKYEGKGSDNFCYLAYMAIRLIEMHRVLKETGSFFFHCDHTMSHYVKILLDIIFGEKNFRNEIIWNYHGPGKSGMKNFNRKHDTIFRYTKSDNFKFNPIYVPYKDPNQRPRKRMNTGQQDWSEEKILARALMGKTLEDWWVIRIACRSKTEYVGYPTQKPLKLLERIIECSTDEGDIVLDAFCGCATTLVQADKMHRRWIGIDISIKAYELVRERIKKDLAFLNDTTRKIDSEIELKTDVPRRTDVGMKEQKEKKYVYVISNEQFEGDYKVGIAKNVKARFNSYQTADPYRAYKLEYSILCTNFREVEKLVHGHFKNNHEWVSGDLKEIIEFIKEKSHEQQCEKQDDFLS